MSLIGLVTATEKQVHLGRLHMRPMQWRLKNNCRVPESLENIIPIPRQCVSRSTITPTEACCANIYRHIKRRVGCSFKRAYCKRNLVHSGKKAVYKLSGTERGITSPKRVPRPLLRQDSSCCNQQYYRRVIHKQGRRHEVGPTVCPTMENLDLVFQEISESQSLTHLRPAKRGSRQTIQARPDHPDGVVPPSRGFSIIMQLVAPAPNRPICHEVQQQVTSVFPTGTRSHGLSSGCSQPTMGRSGHICLPPAAI